MLSVTFADPVDQYDGDNIILFILGVLWLDRDWTVQWRPTTRAIGGSLAGTSHQGTD